MRINKEGVYIWGGKAESFDLNGEETINLSDQNMVELCQEKIILILREPTITGS